MLSHVSLYQQLLQTFTHFIIIALANVVDTLKGADARVLETKINQHKVEVTAFGGKGVSLATPGQALPQSVTGNPISSREARLKAFGHLDAKKSESSTSSISAPTSSTAPSISKLLVEHGEDDEAIGILNFLNPL